MRSFSFLWKIGNDIEAPCISLIGNVQLEYQTLFCQRRSFVIILWSWPQCTSCHQSISCTKKYWKFFLTVKKYWLGTLRTRWVCNRLSCEDPQDWHEKHRVTRISPLRYAADFATCHDFRFVQPQIDTLAAWPRFDCIFWTFKLRFSLLIR